MSSKTKVALPTLPGITVSRLLDAPRDLVFKAFSDPDNIGKWWGPNGFTAYNHEMDFRVGGIWRFDMRGPDGTRFPSHYSVYTEIQPPKLIVYDHYAAEDNERVFQAVIALNEESGRTRVTFSLVCSTIEKRDFLVRYGATEGADQTVARLASYLSQPTT